MRLPASWTAVASTTSHSPGRSTRTRVLPKSSVIAATASVAWVTRPSARHARGTDVPERTVAAVHGAGPGRVIPGADPRRGGGDLRACLLEPPRLDLRAPDEPGVEEMQ